MAELALGTVQLGLPYGAANSTGMPTEEEAVAIVREAVAGGVRELDTAHGYVKSATPMHEVINCVHAWCLCHAAARCARVSRVHGSARVLARPWSLMHAMATRTAVLRPGMIFLSSVLEWRCVRWLMRAFPPLAS
jgi:hypothetical protein